MFDHIKNIYARQLAERLYKQAELSNCNSNEIQLAIAEVAKACAQFPMYVASE